MSHAVESMAYFGKTPWHGLGCEITDPDNLMDSAAFMRAADLDWKVSKVSIRLGEELINEDGGFYLDDRLPSSQIVENQYQLVRNNDGSILSTRPVSETGYKLRQNSQMFDLFNPLIDSGELRFHTAGSLHGGRKVWVLCELLTGFTLPGDDQINNFFLFTMDHSGVGANTAFYTSVRVVCANTCRYAEEGATNKITDTHKVRFDPDKMRLAMDLVKFQSVNFEELAQQLATTWITGEQRVEFFRHAFNSQPKAPKEGGRVKDSPTVQKAIALSTGQLITNSSQGARNVAQDHIDNMLAGVNLDYMDDDIGGMQSNLINPGWDKRSSRGTAWGALNVVSYIEDHEHKRKGTPDNLLHATLYGQKTNDPKMRALGKARELVVA